MRDIGHLFPDMFYSKLEFDPDGAHGVFDRTDSIQDFVDCHMNRSDHKAIGKAKLLKGKNSSNTFDTQCIKPYSSGWRGQNSSRCGNYACCNFSRTIFSIFARDKTIVNKQCHHCKNLQRMKLNEIFAI